MAKLAFRSHIDKRLFANASDVRFNFRVGRFTAQLFAKLFINGHLVGNSPVQQNHLTPSLPGCQQDNVGIVQDYVATTNASAICKLEIA